MKNMTLTEMILVWLLVIVLSAMFYSAVKAVQEKRTATVCPYCKK